MRPSRLLCNLLSICFLIGSSLVAEPAFAISPERREQAKAHFERGRTAFEANTYATALAEYKNAYKIVPLAGLLFNIGQCQRNLNQHEQAIQTFKAYVRSAPNAPNLAAVQRLIADLEAKMAAAGKPPQKPGPPTPQASPKPAAPETKSTPAPKPSSPATQPATQATKPVLTPQQILSDEPGVAVSAAVTSAAKKKPIVRQRPIYKKWWFWTLVTAGVAGSVAGIYFAARTRSPDTAPSRFPTWELPGI